MKKKKRQKSVQSLYALHLVFFPIFQTPLGLVCLSLEYSSNKDIENFPNSFLMNSLREGIRELLVLLLQWTQEVLEMQLQNTEDKRKLYRVFSLSGNNFFSLAIYDAISCFKREESSRSPFPSSLSPPPPPIIKGLSTDLVPFYKNCSGW